MNIYIHTRTSGKTSDSRRAWWLSALLSATAISEARALLSSSASCKRTDISFYVVCVYTHINICTCSYVLLSLCIDTNILVYTYMCQYINSFINT